MVEGVLAVSLFVAPLQALPADTNRLRRNAERAAFRYESVLRRRAPSRLGDGGSTRCDEIIGRFCFRFSTGGFEPPDTLPEHEDVVESRSRAIAAYRAWLTYEPARPEPAGALVRYLVDAGRAPEAVPLARTHVWAAGSDPASLLLLGLALHESGAIEAAEAVFDSARSSMLPGDRQRLDDVEVLLEPVERRWYRRLEPDRREAYNRRFWRLADPSLLLPGNERRSAHYARQAWAAILAEAPNAAGRTSWGRDTEEIVLRYGLPVHRERLRSDSWRLSSELSMVEYFDRHALPFVPRLLGLEGVPPTPEPGATPELERDTVRSAYAPVRLHLTRALAELQVALFPVRAGAVVEVAGWLEPDTTAPVPERPRGLLVLMDTLGRPVSQAPARVEVERDSVTRVWGRVAAPAGSWIYRLEMADSATGQRALAQYRIDVPEPTTPSLSDPWVVESGPSPPSGREALEPRRPVLHPAAAVLFFAEARGLERRGGEARYAVEWSVEPAGPSSLLDRAARWVGRRLGRAEPRSPVRVTWEDVSRVEPIPLPLTLDLADLDPGLYRVRLRITDRLSGRATATERLVRLSEAAAGRPSRGRS